MSTQRERAERGALAAQAVVAFVQDKELLGELLGPMSESELRGIVVSLCSLAAGIMAEEAEDYPVATEAPAARVLALFMNGPELLGDQK